jgi:hypothetical protein
LNRRSVSSVEYLSFDMPKRSLIATITSGGREYPFKLLTPSAAKKVLRPYSQEIGYLAIAWNELHHNLSSLFSLLLRAGHEDYAQAIWHSTESDFSQRKMLRALISSDQNSLPLSRKLTSLQAKEILWILDEIERSLRHKRNNALHAPLMVMTGLADGAVRNWVEAHFNSLNPRAFPLRSKDLIDEFRDYTAHAQMLSRYATKIWNALSFAGQQQPPPWPRRPESPLAHKKKSKPRLGKYRLPAHLRKA